jgi:hypothetical protein
MKNNNKNFQNLEPKVSIAPNFISCFLALALGLFAVMAQAEGYRYRYVSLDDKAPPGFAFFSPGGINDGGRVSGSVYNCDDVSCFDNHVAIYKDGAVTVLQAGDGGPINAGRTIGGDVVLNPDPNNFMTQAALFRRNQVELVFPQSGEIFASVFALNDLGTALVASWDASFNRTNVLYKNGQANVLDFGPTVTNPSFISYVTTGKFINNNGIIAGTTGNGFNGARGFRFNTRTGETTLLKPLPTDTLAWGLGINNRGDVLGYSFVNSRPYHENIGVWDSKGNFKTYFTETISSNMLVFNDNNLIVITLAPGENSYLVPKPGVRLNLADLVENLPLGAKLSYIFGINNKGDMIGFNYSGVGGFSFLLERLDKREQTSCLSAATAALASSGLTNKPLVIPPAVAAILRSNIPQLKPGAALPDPLKNLLVK